MSRKKVNDRNFYNGLRHYGQSVPSASRTGLRIIVYLQRDVLNSEKRHRMPKLLGLTQ